MEGLKRYNQGGSFRGPFTLEFKNNCGVFIVSFFSLTHYAQRRVVGTGQADNFCLYFVAYLNYLLLYHILGGFDTVQPSSSELSMYLLRTPR